MDESDETLAPIISARLIPQNETDSGYNLLQSGTLTIDSLSDQGVSGSFTFQLASTENPDEQIAANGTFTAIPFTQMIDSEVVPTLTPSTPTPAP